jgi:endonuclease YncB( thermonuclease family)
MLHTNRGYRSLLLAAISLTLLSACGGGGDDVFDFTSLSPAKVCVSTSDHVDGDTFRCTTNQTSFVVRLSAVDAPERDQAFSEDSRRELARLTPAGTLVECSKTDVYGRSVCRVYSAAGVDVQARMLLNGFAWYNVNNPFRFGEQTDYEQDNYPIYMLSAQSARRGLWGGVNPQTPRECRAAPSTCI